MCGPRRFGILLLLTFAVAGPAGAWTPASQRTVAAVAARLAPPDLYRQLARNREAYLIGAVDPFRDTDPMNRVSFPDGSGQLDRLIVLAVDNAIASIRAPRPFNEIAYRLGVVAHYLAEANNPLASDHSDPQQGRYGDDFLRYVESTRPRLRIVFYGFRRDFDGRRDLPGLVEQTLARSRAWYRMVSREYKRIDYQSGIEHFNDRSTAYGVASLGFSHAVSDIAEVFRYIWLTTGGIDTRQRLPLRGREIVPLTLDAAEIASDPPRRQIRSGRR